MSLAPDTKVGPYEIVALIGSGGMGEVSRARDTRLARDIALKILPESFARESERLVRFEQEARAVATLNHPNILAVFDIGQHNGSPFSSPNFSRAKVYAASLTAALFRSAKRLTMECRSRKGSPPPTKKESFTAI